ncbi:hypothetical+protein [Methylocapsa aurea]|uniref:hypothetical protein n=1 Tax=Methylocapsa aurea TaxID=663610 RepID=UPI003D189333
MTQDASQSQNAADQQTDDGFEWAVVEIFGHRRHVGRVREEERIGAKMLRVDVPTLAWRDGDDGKRIAEVTGWATHFYGGPAIFSLSLTDEASVLAANRPYDRPARLTYRADDASGNDASESDENESGETGCDVVGF